jgi:hypothetical protein
VVVVMMVVVLQHGGGVCVWGGGLPPVLLSPTGGVSILGRATPFAMYACRNRKCEGAEKGETVASCDEADIINAEAHL